MDVSKHFFYGMIFSAFVYFIYPQIELLSSIIILLSSVLIDVDIYIYYLYKKKSWSLIKAYQWGKSRTKKVKQIPRQERNNIYGGIRFLHGVEILLITFILGIALDRFFFFIFIGLALHLLLDIVDQVIYWDRIDKFSILYDYRKSKKLKYIGDILDDCYR